MGRGQAEVVRPIEILKQHTEYAARPALLAISLPRGMLVGTWRFGPRQCRPVMRRPGDSFYQEARDEFFTRSAHPS